MEVAASAFTIENSELYFRSPTNLSVLSTILFRVLDLDLGQSLAHRWNGLVGGQNTFSIGDYQLGYAFQLLLDGWRRVIEVRSHVSCEKTDEL